MLLSMIVGACLVLGLRAAMAFSRSRQTLELVYESLERAVSGMVRAEELDRQWHAVRQERITNELLEVAAGHQVALATARS